MFGCAIFCLDVCLSIRTLLALGCHVGMGDEKAEENLKRIKLPKTLVTDISVVVIIMIIIIV